MLTRKHFIALADIIKRLSDPGLDTPIADLTAEIIRFCKIYGQNFDEVKFLGYING